MTPQPSALAAILKRLGNRDQQAYPFFTTEDGQVMRQAAEYLAAWPTQAQGESKFRNRDDELFHDHSILPQITPEVMRAAITISQFFKLKGIKKWKFHDLQSREFECERTHPSPSTAADDPNTCVLCKCRLPDAALREALSMLRECVEGEFGLQAWVDTYPCDHTPKLIERARTLLAGDNRG